MTERESGRVRRTLRYIFIGAEGLRAGWSLLLFVAIATLLGIVLSAMLPHTSDTARATPDTPLQTIGTEAISFHAAWNWAQSFLYGVRDSGTMVAGHLLTSHAAGQPLLSGGATGPEGSVLVVPTLLLTIYIIHKTLPKRDTAFDAANGGPFR